VNLQALLDDRGVEGWLHAVDLDSGAETGLGADELVVSASVFKVPVLVELCRQWSAGALSPTQRVHLPAGELLTDGPTGYSVTLDDVDVSLRDLALSMMSVSDNRATDVIMGMLGLDEINATMQRLGHRDTVLVGDCNELFRTIAEDLGVDIGAEADIETAELVQRMRTVRATTPAATTHTTPRETTALFAQLWRDEILDPAACAEARRILGLQVWPHRLGSGFPEAGVQISAKTGTIGHRRNEAGVIEYSDGGRFAVAVFVSSPHDGSRDPVADAAIGALARAAVDSLH
jgi:beta-lactamase class A